MTFLLIVLKSDRIQLIEFLSEVNGQIQIPIPEVKSHFRRPLKRPKGDSELYFTTNGGKVITWPRIVLNY